MGCLAQSAGDRGSNGDQNRFGTSGSIGPFEDVMIKEVIAKQDARKEEVSFKLKEFQKEQQEMAERLKALLTKGRELRIKDLKEMLQEFRVQHKERLVHQIERRKEVNKTLGRITNKTTQATHPRQK